MATTNDLIPNFEDFERYYSGEMSPAEQRLLEGRMLAEPLVAEAYDGFLAWRKHNGRIAGVRADLHQRLHARVERTDRKALPLWAYASAASVLLAMFSYWFVFLRDQTVEVQKPSVAEKQEQVKRSPIQADKTVEAASPAAVAPVAPAKVASVPSQPQLAHDTNILPKPEIALAPSVLADVAVQKEVDGVVLEDSSPIKMEATHVPPRPVETLTTPGAAQAAGKSMAARTRVEREHADTQYLVASQPVSAERKTYSITIPSDTLAPMPAQGWEAYRAYLEKNTGSTSTTGQIMVTFFVSSTGVLSGFVASGPEELHKEAIRIISNGPAWVPARTKGIPVTSRAEIRLQFRQSQ
ncbi:MAG: hypothetical protein J7619_18645 [Dyadobacter sp.]|uniref:hypothetical protein n=1 Tax=Dyadobacter sp. TaxID=1914288 RepID=UPI001B1B839B|nr:hypothetical protein [Dyadobacter sp.]MBO9614727.1 hypothetical protein [Dyadobacter sp.]